MFDTSYNINHQKYSQVVNIKPACNGIIQKSSHLSHIASCSIDSEFARCALDTFNPHLWRKETKKYQYSGYEFEEKVEYPIVVLQVMVFGDNQCLIEYVFEKDLKQEDEKKDEQ